MFDLSAIQAALWEDAVDGWLLYDFRGTNVLARRVPEPLANCLRFHRLRQENLGREEEM